MSLNVELLESSFLQLRDRSPEFTILFYSELFAAHPELEPLFAKTAMEKQGRQLFKSLVMVVDHLRRTDLLTPALQGLGSRHVKYGVLPEHYPMVGGALLKAMAIVLGDAWTPEVQQAWIDAYKVIAQLMLEGTNYPTAVLQPQLVPIDGST
jgi:hemoglobin-like flavoprotein